MNLLLDSHALLWALIEPGKMTAEAVAEIQSPANAVFFSAASVWELELKCARGKLRLPADWLSAARKTGFTELVADADSAAASARLPWHHTDPFDRLLIAQALDKKFTFATRDAAALLYAVPILKV
ncbi:type II toxin-antitoxin system VapC family toxin [soil metagenome]